MSTDVDLDLGNIGVDLDLDADMDVDIGGDLDVDLNGAMDIGLDKIKAAIEARLPELAPVFLNFLWKEIPLVKISFPHRYRLKMCLFGKEVLSLEVCGESEVVTDKNVCPPTKEKGLK